ncbi:MAG TPA: hypothetical protein VN513_06395, partial [Gemmatimonadales bacterium]|nr:hypothetical protein [Gemmatimonadales bacterium]
MTAHSKKKGKGKFTLREIDQLAALQAELAAWKQPGELHDAATCKRGSLCPYCEIARLQAMIAAAEGERDAARADRDYFQEQALVSVRRAEQAEAKLAALQADHERADKAMAILTTRLREVEETRHNAVVQLAAAEGEIQSLRKLAAAAMAKSAEMAYLAEQA